MFQLRQMKDFPLHLAQKLDKRKAEDAFRELPNTLQGIDFCSNDYLGLARDPEVLREALHQVAHSDAQGSGASGSRLISGNHSHYEVAESYLADLLQDESALIFNSGYDANTGLISAVAGRADILLYDEWVHASIREGIRLSPAKSIKFLHNSVDSLQEKLEKHKASPGGAVYVITEGVFSMDGDIPDLVKMSEICSAHGARLIVDEAHALGVSKHTGLGESIDQGVTNSIFARVFTFGKAAGVQGAAVVGSRLLKDYLINFSRPLIYTTALPPLAVAGIVAGVKRSTEKERRDVLRARIAFFRQLIGDHKLVSRFLPSETPIQSWMMPGNSEARLTARHLQQAGFQVKAILSPTVPKGTERLRICLHAFNTEDDIIKLIHTLQKEL